VLELTEVVREDGEVIVVAAGPEFRHIATNTVGEFLMATPALSGPRSHIWASIAARCAPSESSISADLAKSPTIPHICPESTPAESECSQQRAQN